MSSYYVENLNPTNNSPSGSFSSSSSTKSFHTKTKTTKPVRLSTDPQSIAARQRRHRISDRFKILQSLVPGGSKLDTVSMLDEAIHYVKFLKAQILLHHSLALLISSAPVPDQNDQIALPEANDDFFAQMQLSDLPEGYFHFQGQECNFSRGTQCFEY